MKNKGKFKVDLNPVSGSEKWFDFERLGFIEKAIQRHLDKPRGDSKKSLKRLRAERTRLRNKYLIGQVIEIDFEN
tara:strand:+ start:1679 stop:1903 length:225 start_codon:yes stop_codon:yes gene_type:complete